VRLKKGRVVSIAAAGFTATLLWILYAVLSVHIEYGSLSLVNFKLMLDEAFVPVKQALEGLTYEKNGETVSFYTSSDIDLLVYNIKTMLLGSLTAIMMIVAYLVTLVSRFIANSFDQPGLFPVGYRIRMRRVINENGPAVELIRETVQWRIELDSVTAIIFIASYLVSILFSSSSGTSLSLTLTAQNLILILIPGFIYAGVRDIMLGFSGGAPILGRGCLMFAFAGVLVFINPLTLFLLLAVIGVSSTLRENHRRAEANKDRKE
jgi:hypothetical protein